MAMQDIQNVQQDQQDDKPLISFIITYYDLPSDMLCECIESILALSLRPFEREIIVVDDGSEVSPIDRLTDFYDDIIYLRKPNGGLSDARNMGLDIAHGEYIQFVDADDMLIQAPYENCIDITRFRNADVVMFEATEDENPGISIEETIPVTGTEYMHHHNLRAAAWGYIFKRTVLGNLRFHKGIYHEDEEFTPQLLLRAELLYPTQEKAYRYRQRENSITNNHDKDKVQKRLKDTKTVIYKLQDLASHLPKNDSLAIQRRVAQLTMDFIYHVMVETQSSKQLEIQLQELTDRGLFPLPDKDYSTKYKWFRKLTAKKWSRTVLLRTLPLINMQ